MSRRGTGRAPGSWPLLGHSLALHRDPLRFLAGLPAYGDLVEIGVGPYRAAVMRERTAELLAGWRDGQCVDMVAEMFRLTTSVALRALFSSHIDTGAADRLRDAFDVFLRGTYARVTLPGFARLPLPRRLPVRLHRRTDHEERHHGTRSDHRIG